MSKNKDNDQDSKVSLIVIVLVSLILIIFIFALIINYIWTNYKKILLNSWIDLIIIIFISIIFLFLYIITLIVNKNLRVKNFEECASNSTYILSNSFFMLFVYTLINNIVFDIVQSIYVFYKVLKIFQIEERGIEELIKKFQELDIMKMIRPFMHKLMVIIMNGLNLFLTVFYYFIYTNITIQDEIISLKMYKSLIKVYTYSTLLFFILSIIVIQKVKEYLIEKDFISNKVNYIYQLNFEQAIIDINIILFKFSIDLIVNIPLLFYISLQSFSCFSVSALTISIIVYIYLSGNLFISIDIYINKNSKRIIPKIIKNLFCYKNLQIQFFNQNIINFIELLDCPELKNILEPKDCTFQSNQELSKLEKNSEKKNYKSEDSSIKDFINNNIDNKSIQNIYFLEETKDYYILFKLLYLFFEKNKISFSGLKKKIQKTNFSLERVPILKKTKTKGKELENILNIEEYLKGINKVARISEGESKNLAVSFNFNPNNVFETIEEKEMFEKISKKLKKNKNQKLEFIIEALSYAPLFEIFPLYQLKIDDILKSLFPQNNLKLFDLIIENKNKIGIEKEKSENNVKNNEEYNENVEENEEIEDSEDIIKIEDNSYYTQDFLLTIEIYKKKDFLNYKQITKLTSSFREYIMKTSKKLRFTFLQLILGIYNIKFLGYDIIVVLYRNPLYSSKFSIYKNWINYNITEEGESNKKSQESTNNVVDENQIGIKDNLNLTESDYEQIKDTLKNDFDFLKNLNLQIFAILNLFIGEEKTSIEEQLKKNHTINESIPPPSYNSEGGLSNLLNISVDELLYATNSLKNKDEHNSILEREYYISENKDFLVIKIYISNYFRYCSKLNESNEQILNVENYSKYLQQTILSYLKKNDLFPPNEENNKDIKEKQLSK